MKMGVKPIAAWGAALATCVALLLAGCNIAEEGYVTEPKIASTQIRTLSASGSTAIAPLMDRWSKEYANSHPVQINYRPTGSGAGIDNLRHGNGAFAATDAPLGDDQLQGLPPMVQIPISTGPVCVVYNLSGLKTPLRLSGKTLAGIYASEIISWQDPAIASENPGAALPHAAIIVVHRSDGSGTTNILSNYLSKASPSWASKFGQGLTIKWPAGIGVSGSTAVLHTVIDTPGTIGYLELTFARSAGLSVASIKNEAGEFVVPTPASAYLAVSAASDLLAKDPRYPVVDPPATAKGAYPITGITFVLIPMDNRSTDGEQAALGDFLGFVLSAGQSVAEELSYAKLPASLQHQGQELLAQLTDNRRPIKQTK